MHVRSLLTSVRSFRRAAAVLLPLAVGTCQPGAASAQQAPQVGIQHVFDNSSGNGAHATGGLIQGKDGNFYGTTARGGGSNNGTVYQLKPDNTFTLLYAFGGGDSGGEPGATLVTGADGAFYGTTQFGGKFDEGTVFRITTNGSFGVLYNFAGGDGAEPVSSLIVGTDGNFYGTTEYGGDYDKGTVFRLTPGGLLNVLFSFGGGYGAQPIGALLQASDGNFYGTTQYGGLHGEGTVFQLTPTGSLTVLHDFQGSEGKQPQGTLVQTPDGTLYGTATLGGSGDYGTAFSLTTDGSAFTKLHDFSGADGSRPESGLIVASDGNLYGTTYYGGDNDNGTVFELTPAGGFADLVFLSRDYGQYPSASLLQAADGTLYDGTYGGGGSDDGTVFRVDVGLPAPVPATAPVITSPATASTTVGAAFAFGITATHSPTSFAASPLPPGVNFNPANGLIAGQVTVPGTYVINLSATNASGTGKSTLTLTVTQTAVIPALVLRAFVPLANYQSGQDGEFAIYLTEATTVDLTINYKVSGSAVGGTDYKRLSGVLTIPAGQTYGLVDVVPKSKLKGRGNRGVLLTLTPGSGYTVQPPASAKVTASYE